MGERDYNLIVGPKIKGIRDYKQIKQETLAGALKVNQSTISRIESGEQGISFDMLCAIADALEVNVNAIINLDSNTVFNSYHCHQAGMHNHYNNSGFEEYKLLSEQLIGEKDKVISIYQEQLSTLRDLIKSHGA